MRAAAKGRASSGLSLGFLSHNPPGAPPHLRWPAARAHFLPLNWTFRASSSRFIFTLTTLLSTPARHRQLPPRCASRNLSTAAAAQTIAIMGEPKWTAAAVRTTFLDFFEARGHTVGSFACPRAVPSLPGT